LGASGTRAATVLVDADLGKLGQSLIGVFLLLERASPWMTIAIKDERPRMREAGTLEFSSVRNP
jgi:hypothetical protein